MPTLDSVYIEIIKYITPSFIDPTTLFIVLSGIGLLSTLAFIYFFVKGIYFGIFEKSPKIKAKKHILYIFFCILIFYISLMFYINLHTYYALVL